MIFADFFQSFLLGSIQGIAEFLPVSSSGHLVLLPWLFKWDYQGVSYDVMLHAGSLLAVLIYFRRDVLNLMKAMVHFVADYKSGSLLYRKLLGHLVLATIPAVVIGLMFDDFFSVFARQPLIIASALIFMGLLLGLADRVAARRAHYESLADMKWWHAFLIGCFQVLALIPGSSRSGTSISGALLLGYNRQDSTRFSFLLSLPIIGGAVILSSYKIWQSGESFFTLPALFGVLVSFVTAYIAISFLMHFVQRYRFTMFVWYRVVLGLTIIALWYFV